jgi:hypothetical protein
VAASLQHQAATLSSWIQTTSAGKHHPHGAKTDDALTLKPDQSVGAGQWAAAVSLIIAALCVLDYEKNVAPISRADAAYNRYVQDVVGNYLKQYPETRVVCVNGSPAGLCEVDRTFNLYYRPIHDANVRNRPLPKDIAGTRYHFVQTAYNHCPSLTACGFPDFESGRRYLILGRVREAPPEILDVGRPLPVPAPLPPGLYIREIR